MGTETLFQEQLWAQLALIETIYTPYGDENFFCKIRFCVFCYNETIYTPYGDGSAIF